MTKTKFFCVFLVAMLTALVHMQCKELSFKDLASSINLEIPDTVTSIGVRAFSHNRLTSVMIPDSVESIGMWAFSDNQLMSVTIGKKVRTIDMWAFAFNKLKSVIIPNSVESIGDVAFVDNELTSVTIGDSVKTIGLFAFSGNPLTTVTLTKKLYDKTKGYSKGHYGFINTFGDQVTMYQEHDGTVIVASPGAVSNLSVTESGGTFTITATPPDNRGKTDDIDVGEEDIKYALYYVLVGDDDGVSIFAASNTTAIKAIEVGSRLSENIIGKQEIRGNTNLAAGFTIADLTAGATYRYFISSIHPNEDVMYSDTLVFALKPN